MNESKPTSGWNEAKPSFPIAMNVGEAMAYASKNKCFWTGEMHSALETLAAEVERLRSELAAAKAASVCPVEPVALSDAVWQCSVGVKSGEDADRLYNWLRDRMKERGEG